MENDKFSLAFGMFLKTIEDVYNEYWERNGFTHEQDKLSYKVGKKYTKIVRGSSVFCFVDQEGNVLRAASYKAPAKGVRGSIYINGGRDAIGPHGANYLR